MGNEKIVKTQETVSGEIEWDKLINNEAFRDLIKAVRDEKGDLYQGDEEILREAAYYGLKKMVGKDGREEKTEIKEVLFLADRTFAVVNKLSAENVKLDKVVGMSAKIDALQDDIDEIYRMCKNTVGIKAELRGVKARYRSIGEKVNRILDRVESLLFEDKTERAVDLFGKDEGAMTETEIEGKSAVVEILDIVGEILELLGKEGNVGWEGSGEYL